MMSMLHILRGTLLVEAPISGFERFINICRANHIRLWDIRKEKERYTFCMGAGDFKALRPIVRKTRCRLKILKKHGLPFFLFRYRKHYCFVIGISLAVGILYGLSQFVWSIEFEGNFFYTDNMLMKYLNGQGISTGGLVKDLNCPEIEKSIRKEFEEITWVSAELTGTRLILHIKENDGAIVVSEAPKAGNLVASRPGTVMSIITRKGTPQVTAGAQVEQGDILVSSEVIVYNDAKEPVSSYFVTSEADIFIQTVYTYEDILEARYQYKIYTGREKNYITLGAFNHVLEIGGFPGKFENWDESSWEENCRLNPSFYLPFSYGRKTQYEYYYEESQYTQEQAEGILNANLEAYLKKMEKRGIQITNTSVKIESQGDRFVMSGDITVIQQAYEFVPVTDEVQ